MSIWLLMFAAVVCLSGCGNLSDQEAYKEVVATMSMEKAKRFFDRYPESPYWRKLGDEIVEWCKGEETEECYRLLIETLPKNHPRYQEVAVRYEERFGKEAQ